MEGDWSCSIIRLQLEGIKASSLSWMVWCRMHFKYLLCGHVVMCWLVLSYFHDAGHRV